MSIHPVRKDSRTDFQKTILCPDGVRDVHEFLVEGPFAGVRLPYEPLGIRCRIRDLGNSDENGEEESSKVVANLFVKGHGSGGRGSRMRKKLRMLRSVFCVS